MNRKRIEKILHNCSKTIEDSVNMVGASNEIVKYIKDLEQQVEKQKEVIDKAIEFINECMMDEDDDTDIDIVTCLLAYEVDELLDILKGGGINER